MNRDYPPPKVTDVRKQQLKKCCDKVKAKFKREHRYVVLKVSEIEKYLDVVQKDKLIAICNEIDDHRAIDNKGTIECVVVEHDWPMYEQTWTAIQKHVESK